MNTRRKFLDLTDADIKKNRFAYDTEQLEYTLQTYPVSLRVLARNQKLTPYICAKYVIFGGNNEEYGDCTEDRWLDDYNILYLQKHISREELSQAHRFVAQEEANEAKELELMRSHDIKFL